MWMQVCMWRSKDNSQELVSIFYSLIFVAAYSRLAGCELLGNPCPRLPSHRRGAGIIDAHYHISLSRRFLECETQVIITWQAFSATLNRNSLRELGRIRSKYQRIQPAAHSHMYPRIAKMWPNTFVDDNIMSQCQKTPLWLHHGIINVEQWLNCKYI